ncbi:MAG: PEGA domain-containing protein [Proteiniphilum sp.]|nr:PEGA domain-containing protein [Bacteroidales bacterium]
MKSSALLMAVVVLFASCSSTTLIQSEPSGAKLYMNGEYMGVTPFSYSDTKIVGSSTEIRLEKEGYEPLYTMMSRDETADVGAIIGGVFFLFPFLWTMKYKPTHNYELIPLSSAALMNSEQPALMTDANGNEYLNCVLKD